MLITPQEALKIVLSAVKPLKAVRRALRASCGWVLAQDLRADRDQPPADRSAMDGYAVRSADLKELPARLHLVGEIPAGSASRPRVRPGTCALVLTGANIPPGADAVVMQEHTAEGARAGAPVVGEHVTFTEPVSRGENIRLRGEEARRGDVLLKKGTALGPLQIGVAAGIGKARVLVHARPRVRVLVTGQEVRRTGDPVAAHQLRDSNGPALVAALELAGSPGATRRIVPDDLGQIAQTIRSAAREADVVVITGGVSVGKYDLVPSALEKVGARFGFHGVNMKPGRPQLYFTLRARGGRRTHIFGLPGNPMSVMTGFHEFVLPALRRLSGLPEASCRPNMRLPLAARIRSKGRRAWFAPARLVRTEWGMVAEVIGTHGSADIIAASAADGAAAIPAGVRELQEGALVDFRPWRAIP